MPRRTPRVLSIGDAIVDVVTPPLKPFPSGDAQLRVRGIDLLPGGNATNFALGVAALGARTAFVGCLGQDPLATVLRSAYRAHQVETHVRVDLRRPTGATAALTWADGSRALITAIGANEGLAERDVPRSLLASADHVHRAGFWWTPRLRGPATVRILAQARKAGARTSLDVSTDPDGWPRDHVASVRACLPHVDTFFGNEAEVTAIAGRSDPLKAARSLCGLGAREVVLHQGARGATLVASREIIRVPGFRVPVDNPTGCGDVFNAGYVWARLRDVRGREVLLYANACAALHLQDRGTPYPTAAQVVAFLAAGHR